MPPKGLFEHHFATSLSFDFKTMVMALNSVTPFTERISFTKYCSKISYKITLLSTDSVSISKLSEF